VEEGGDLVGDLLRHPEDVEGRQSHVLGEAAGAVDPQPHRVPAEVTLAGAAVAAVAAGDVALAADPLAHLEAGDLVAEPGDLPHELVADDHRELARPLRPGGPVPGVDVGAA